MGNGLRIRVSEQEFKSMPPADQNWMLFQAIFKIDQFGCDWASKHYKDAYWKKLAVLGSGFGGGFGFSILIGRAFRLW